MEKKMCKKCENRGYVEVVYDDGDFIEACMSCDQFENVSEKEFKAREAAKKDGYILTGGGKVIDFKRFAN